MSSATPDTVPHQADDLFAVRNPASSDASTGPTNAVSDSPLSSETVDLSDASAPSPDATTASEREKPLVEMDRSIALDIDGLDKSQTGKIDFKFHNAELDATGATTSPARVSVDLKGIMHLIDADGAVVSPSRREAQIEIPVVDDKDPKHAEIEAAIRELSDGAAVLRGSFNHRDAQRKAEYLIESGFKKLLAIDGAKINSQSLGIGDPRAVAIRELIEGNPELELISEADSGISPTRSLTNTAIGSELLVARTREVAAGIGNVATTAFEVTMNGIEVEMHSDVRLSDKQESAGAYLNNFRALDLNHSRSVAEESVAIREICEKLLPARDANLLNPDGSIFNSGSVQELLNHGDLSAAKGITISGVGQLHEQLDPAGARLVDVTIADGVFYCEGLLRNGTTIVVKKGATLMIDAFPGSSLKIVIEEGGKVMSGPKGLGLSGCRVSGEIHGDASELDMRGVEWDASMTVANFKRMIFNSALTDEKSRELFIAKSKPFTDLAKLIAVDRKNLSIGEIGDLLSDKFDVINKGNGTYLVVGNDHNKGTLYRETKTAQGEKAIQVIGVASAPGSKVEDLHPSYYEEDLAQPDPKDLHLIPHDALREILAQLRGGASSSANRVYQKVEGIMEVGA